MTPSNSITYQTIPTTCGYQETITYRYFKDSVEQSSPPGIFTLSASEPISLTIESSEPSDAGDYRIEVTNTLDFNNLNIVTDIDVTVQISCNQGELTILDGYIPGNDSLEYIIGHAQSSATFDRTQFESTATEASCPTMTFYIYQDGYP